MKNVVRQMLIDLGVNPSNKGFSELSKAILMVVDKGEPMMMKEIYQSLYPESEVKYCAFDRNCRWAIENAYLVDTEMFKRLFGQTEKCPNLKFFIHAVATEGAHKRPSGCTAGLPALRPGACYGSDP